MLAANHRIKVDSVIRPRYVRKHAVLEIKNIPFFNLEISSWSESVRRSGRKRDYGKVRQKR